MKKIPEELLEEDKNLVYSIAIKFKNLIDIEDAFQAGVIGLIKAYNNYEEEKNSNFSSYAYMYIYGEIVSLVRNNRNIKISDEYFKVYQAYEKSKSFLMNHLNREVSLDEVSKFMKVDYSYLSYVLSVVKFTISFNGELNDEDYSLEKVIGFDNSESIDNMIDLKDALLSLDEKERELIMLRYYKNYTQSEVAKKLLMSQVGVSRSESNILRKMHDIMKV